MHVGFDFGTSYTKLGYIKDDSFVNLCPEERIPSLAALHKTEKSLLYGYIDIESLPAELVTWPFFKLALKRNRNFYLGNYSLLEILTGYFTFIKNEYLRNIEDSMDSLTVSVPNYFGMNARRIILQTAKQVFPSVRHALLPEPVAALSGFNSLTDKPVSGEVLSIDIGGGTSDISFLSLAGDGQEILLETQLQMGHDAFSGSEIDKAIIQNIFFPLGFKEESDEIMSQLFNSSFNHSLHYYQLLREAERVKIALNHQFSVKATIPSLNNNSCISLEINRDLFAQRLQPVFSRLYNYIDNTVKNRANQLGLWQNDKWTLDHVLIMGGASKTPGLQKLLQDLLGTSLIFPEDVEFNVVRGLSLWGARQASTRVKTIYPFQFYIQKRDMYSGKQSLEYLPFDTANLELDINACYPIATIPLTSPFNLANETGKFHLRIYEVEEHDPESVLERFFGQDTVLDFQADAEQLSDPLEIIFDLTNYSLSTDNSLMLQEAPIAATNHDFLNYAWAWEIIDSYRYFQPALAEDMQSEKFTNDDDNSIRLKLLSVLQLLTS
ncbi:MAG: Hsp70 family protein [Syntrophomonadaceae bacterium]|nr:Hsp70 family protein [Syntrophomonadaceae bacterium]